MSLPTPEWDVDLPETPIVLHQEGHAEIETEQVNALTELRTFINALVQALNEVEAVTWDTLSGRPEVVAAGENASDAREAINAASVGAVESLTTAINAVGAEVASNTVAISSLEDRVTALENE